MSRRITNEQKAYIKEHINDYPRKEVAKKAGITMRSLYRYVRMYEGKKKEKYTKETYERISRMYETMTAREIFEETKIPISTVIGIASRLGLKHDNATQDRINRCRRASLDKYWTKEKYEESGRKRHRKYKMEEVRVMSGMRQETNLRIRKLSKTALSAKMYLHKTYGYSYCEDEPLTLLWKDGMRRCKRESYYTEKFGFKFDVF